jgi:tetratricopeptide (TPR) repeat protein
MPLASTLDEPAMASLPSGSVDDRIRTLSRENQGVIKDALTKSENIANAITAFQRAIASAPYWAYPRHNLALTYAEAGEFDQAIRQYLEARLLDPSYSDLAYNLGVLYQQINDVSAARAAYRDALRLSERDCSAAHSTSCPSAARARTALGVLFETSSKWKSAEKEYETAIRADVLQLDAKHDLASVWTRSKRHARERSKCGATIFAFGLTIFQA